MNQVNFDPKLFEVDEYGNLYPKNTDPQTEGYLKLIRKMGKEKLNELEETTDE